jgi:hypothetical protein
LFVSAELSCASAKDKFASRMWGLCMETSEHFPSMASSFPSLSAHFKTKKQIMALPHLSFLFDMKRSGESIMANKITEQRSPARGEPRALTS